MYFQPESAASLTKIIIAKEPRTDSSLCALENRHRLQYDGKAVYSLSGFTRGLRSEQTDLIFHLMKQSQNIVWSSTIKYNGVTLS